jgi:acyl carrier protein
VPKPGESRGGLNFKLSAAASILNLPLTLIPFSSTLASEREALDTRRQLLGLILRFATTVHLPDELLEDTPLGSAGLGMDSVAILELLFECEKRFGLEPATLLSEHRSLTV